MKIFFIFFLIIMKLVWIVMKPIKVTKKQLKALDILWVEYEEWHIEYVDNPNLLSSKDIVRLSNWLALVWTFAWWYAMFGWMYYAIHDIDLFMMLIISIPMSACIVAILFLNQEIRFKY